MTRTGPLLGAATLFFLLASSVERVFPQQDYGNRLGYNRGGEVAFRPQGPWVDTGALDLAVKKRYLPQELYQEYRWKTWEYTNYTKRRYLHYVDPFHEGDYFYDFYGNFLTKGWLIYDWTEERPRTSEGSRILQRPEYAGIFGNLVIASDLKGQYAYSITIGDKIFTTLTPMTFRKAVFNGIQVDFRSDDLSVTGLSSRISAPGFITDPNPASFNSYTNLLGGRATVNLGDHVTVGGTLVNAHTGRATLESFKGNLFKGALTARQLEDQIESIVIRLSDDSPADAEGGAVLLAESMEITTVLGERDTVFTGGAINSLLAEKYRTLAERPPPFPRREGGVFREGVRVADGSEQILLRYDLNLLAEAIGDVDIANQIKGVRFRLVLVNDYKVEITSDAQTNAEAQPVFLLVAQAEGNVKNGSNRTEVVFDYGLPTANQVVGLTVEVRDLMGFDLYTEFDVNHRYRQYPNRRLETHAAASGLVGDEAAAAWMINLAKVAHPWFFFAEGFYMEAEYNTSPFIVDGFGRVDYEDPTRNIYDFVDDNDDQDRLPDQKRLFQDPRTGLERGAEGRSAKGFADDAVFPGWDENNDFISDFNQNDNLFQRNKFPDYDEPFLRYASDRPEFLFGMDLNNNGWVDRFENDNEPDYPYKRDHKGYNIYFGVDLTPHVKLTAGQVRQSLISDDRTNRTTYGLFAFEKNYAGIGKIRLFDLFKKAKDDIQDDLFQWIQLPGAPGSPRSIADPLFAEDAWINTAYAEVERRSDVGVRSVNKLKYETVRPRRDGSRLGAARDTRFFGLINKVDYLYQLGRLSIQPKFKSELLKDNTPYSVASAERESWSGLFFLVFKFPLMTKTTIETGFEQEFFQDMVTDEKSLGQGAPTGDLRNTVVAAQLTNRGEYLGYRLITQLGVSLNHSSLEIAARNRKTRTGNFVYATVYAGLE